MKLQKETIIVEIFYDNVNAYNAVYKALLDASLRQAENYHVKVRLIEDVKCCKDKQLNTPSRAPHGLAVVQLHRREH